MRELDPASEHGDNRGLKCNRDMGFVARLNTDKNIILGSILYPNFKGVYYSESGVPTVVETADLDKIDFLKGVPSCRLSWHKNPVWSQVVAGGSVHMDNGAVASLYVACIGGHPGYYNSIMEKTYYVNDTIANTSPKIQLLLARYKWIFTCHPMGVQLVTAWPVGYKQDIYNGRNWRLRQMITNRHSAVTS